MLFNSTVFFCFLAVVYPAFWFSPRRLRNPLLLAASYFFYGYWDYRFLALLALSTVVDYFAALWIQASADAERRRRVLYLSMGLNLGVLGFFKYFGFFVESASTLLSTLGLPNFELALGIVLPVGISFYTFQSMAYTIDVYRGRLDAERSLIDFALYVSYFPQLVAGPIERASRLLPQLKAPTNVSVAQIANGLWLILFGLLKKVVIADNAAKIANSVFEGPVPADGLQVWVGVYAFAFQIYGDFSGYTDIARGVSKLFGVELMLNFRRPYFSTNPQEFWQRWHISLSTWLRDYLYIPLGGNRGGPSKTVRNLMVTMLLGGLWHGAAWGFVAWGLLHGLYLVVHRVWSSRLGTMDLRWQVRVFSKVLSGLLLFHAVCLAWVFFRAQGFEQAMSILSGLFSAEPASMQGEKLLGGLLIVVTPLLFFDVWAEISERRAATGAARQRYDVAAERVHDEFLISAPVWAQGLCLAAAVAALAIMGSPVGEEFIYFAF